MKLSRTCKNCGTILRSTKYDLCYKCRIKANRKPDKFCSICHTKISNRSKQEYCKPCLHFVNHTQHCNCCNTNSYFTKLNQPACNICIKSGKYSIEYSLNRQNMINNLKEQFYRSTDLDSFLFNLLFNKFNYIKTKGIILTKYDSLKLKYIKHIDTVISKLCNHIINIPNWTLNDNNHAASVMRSILRKTDGYVLKNGCNSKYFNFEKDLPAIYNLWRIEGEYWKNSQAFINALIDFKLSEHAGPGEFFLSLILDEPIKYNNSNQGDITTAEHKIEVKQAINYNKAGRLLFDRKNWFMIKSENINEVKNKLIKYIHLIDQNMIEQLNDIIYKAGIYDFTLNDHGLFNSLYKGILNINGSKAAQDFILFILTEFIFKNTNYKFRFLNEVDFTNENQVKAFFLVNYLKYYLDYDTNNNSEELTLFSFISYNGVLNITVDDIYNSSLENLVNIIKDANVTIAHPIVIETKGTKIVHDRNKSFAPGIIIDMKQDIFIK